MKDFAEGVIGLFQDEWLILVPLLLLVAWSTWAVVSGAVGHFQRRRQSRPLRFDRSQD